MQKRLAAKIKDAGLLFPDAGPASHLGEHVVEVVELLGRQCAIDSTSRRTTET